MLVVQRAIKLSTMMEIWFWESYFYPTEKKGTQVQYRAEF